MTASQLLRNTTSVELELWRAYFQEREYLQQQASEEARLSRMVNAD